MGGLGGERRPGCFLLVQSAGAESYRGPLPANTQHRAAGQRIHRCPGHPTRHPERGQARHTAGFSRDGAGFAGRGDAGVLDRYGAGVGLRGWLRWVPVAGYQPPADGVLAWLSTIVLPAAALGLSQVGVVARMLRDGLIDAIADAYTTTARAKGLSPRQVIWDHALRNTLVRTLTVLGNSLGGLLAGAVIIETVFNIRGIGWLAVQAVLQRDHPLVQGCVLLAAVTYSLVNLLVDISYGIVDPRIRIT